MRISIGSSCRDRRGGMLGWLQPRLCLFALLFTTPGSSARAGRDEARAAFQRGDYEAAFVEVLPLALAGGAWAQFVLGFTYYFGWGVPQDYSEAVRWYRSAAEQGVAEAQHSIGLMYYDGEGVPQDSTIAAQWLLRAAEQGHTRAQFNLGTMYYNGEGVPQSHTEAARWYRRAAKQGDANAQGRLGTMYRQGLGVPQDYVEAARWARRGAEQGDAKSQILLAGLYTFGAGVPQDDVLAYMWLILAAEALPPGEDRDQAAQFRNTAAKYLSIAEIARAQRMAHEWRPSVETTSRADDPTTARMGADPASRLSADTVVIQVRLADLGYDPGPADGITGPKTRAAIRAFQADVGLPVDGEISDALTAALSDAASSGRNISAPPGPEQDGILSDDGFFGSSPAPAKLRLHGTARDSRSATTATSSQTTTSSMRVWRCGLRLRVRTA